jgi:hypothetical protein
MAAANSMPLSVMLTMMIALAAVEILLRLANKKYGGGGVGGGTCATDPAAAATAAVRCGDDSHTSVDSQSVTFYRGEGSPRAWAKQSRGCTKDVCSGSGSGSDSELRAHRRWRRRRGRRRRCSGWGWRRRQETLQQPGRGVKTTGIVLSALVTRGAAEARVALAAPVVRPAAVPRVATRPAPWR